MPRRVDPGTINTTAGSGAGGSATVALGDIPALSEHIGTDVGAHPASAISTDAVPGILSAVSVEGSLDELSALVPREPPVVGEFDVTYDDLTIPDWGVLKLRDSGRLADGSVVASPAIWPSYWTGPDLADTEPFDPNYDDPVTDTEFNIFDGVYQGGGEGVAHAGAFNRAGTTTVTHRVTGQIGQAVVSGILYPADRGVLALVRWTPGETLAPIATALDLAARCPAAILLGAGADSTTGCDGAAPAPGLDTGLAFYGEGGDPTSFPGLASGQYNLNEIHTAVRFDLSGPLPAPFNVADNTVGQVRLGTDPGIGPVIVGLGIPILGGGTAARGGGDDNNFFGYRLPALSDYTGDTGLPWTPEAEYDRYFGTPAISASSSLTVAGNYTAFPGNFWGHQVARYRHVFTVPGNDVGGYALAHFKTEGAFEDFVLNGVIPSADDIYNVQLADYATLENLTNLYAGTPANASDEYHTLRSTIYTDPQGADANTNTTAEFNYSRVADDLMYVSGVAHHKPQTRTGATNFRITSMDVLFEDSTGAALGESGFWENTFYTHDSSMSPFGDGRDDVSSRNPMAVYLGTMSVESGAITFAGGPVSVNADERAGRVELNYLALNPNTIPWAGAEPVITDHAGFDFNAGDSLVFSGDETVPRFSEYSRPLVLVRRPVRSLTGDQIFAVDESSAGDQVLTHGGGGSAPQYGNLEDIVVEITNFNVGAVTDVNPATMPVSFSFSVTTQGTITDREVTEVVCGGSSTLSPAGPGDYFILDTPGVGNYYVWFNVGGGNVDPVGPGIGVEVPLTSGTLPDFIVAAELRRVIGGVVDLTNRYPYGAIKPLDSLYTGIKDVEERFLDETYRYQTFFFPVTPLGVSTSGLPGLSPALVSSIEGPGLPASSAIDFPVRPYSENRPEYAQAGTVTTAFHYADLSSVLLVWKHAQVRGFPDRLPPVEDGVEFSTPSAGRLTYPKIDYTTGYRPSVVGGDIVASSPQPDYSILSGDPNADVLRYMRAFDVGFNQIGFESHVGESEFILRLRGITYEDIAYVTPGPGGLGMAVEVKIPGLTSWCDVGRADGTGPSKISATEDGAGCAMLSASETFDGIDDEGIVFTQVRINMAPGTFFLNSDGEQPVLVRVKIRDTVAGRDLDFERHDGADSVTVRNRRLRGLIGMSIIREDEAFTTTAYLNNRLDSGLEDVEALDTGIVAVYET